MGSLSFLPLEIREWVMGYLDAHACGNLRLSCKALNDVATPHLLKTVRFELTKSGCDALANVAGQPVLATCVKNLVLQRASGHQDWEKPSKWRWALDLPGCPRDRFAYLPRISGTQTDDPGLLTHSEWLALPFHKKEALYEQYEKERKQRQEEEVQTLVRSLRHCTSRPILFRDNGTRQLAAALAQDNVIDIFRQSITRLTNLTVFSHQPGWKFDKDWGCRWRNLRFNRAAIRCQARNGRDEDAEALQLSIALHAIGQAPGLGRLQRISLSVDGPAFWGDQRLQDLWSSGGCNTVRLWRDEVCSATEADRMASHSFDRAGGQGQCQKEDYPRQLSVLTNAFVNLTALDCFIREDGLIGALSAATDQLFEVLCRASKLQKLGLGLRDHHDKAQGFLADKGAAELLGSLAERKPWPDLREVHLRVATDQDTLLAFLTAHKESLRILKLSHVTLYSHGTIPTSWDSALLSIGSMLKLEELTLSTLCDFLVRNESSAGLLFNPGDRYWREKGLSYLSFHEEVTRRVLRQENLLSLEPETYL